MRTLKFRVWCSHQNCFDFVDLYKDDFNIKKYVNPKINQFTCLTDSNGNNIYEDDILEIKNGFERFIVKYEIDKYVVESLDKNFIIIKSNLSHFLNLNIFSSKVLIIGNLFENPEITKGTRQNNIEVDQDIDSLLKKL